MADEMSQEEAMAHQKANCIFCKIASGEVPSKKVFEDEKMLAILDINPSVQGHTLVLTKEHYPIMPLIPPDEFSHLFGNTAMLARALMQGMISQRCSVFIANGGVAGQQSPHFLFHMMPREDGDTLQSLNIPQNGVNQSDIEPLIKQNLYSVMREHLTKQNKAHLLQVGDPVTTQEPKPTQEQPSEIPLPSTPPPQQSQQQMTLGDLARVLDENPDIREVLEHDPDRLQAILDENPELKSLFGGVDIHQLSKELQKIDGPTQEPQDLSLQSEQPTIQEQPQEPSAPIQESKEQLAQDPNVPTPPKEPTPQEPGDIIPASQMTLQQIVDFIDQKPKLKELILNDPEKLKELVKTNERLQIFFSGVNPDAIIQAYVRFKGETNAL